MPAAARAARGGAAAGAGAWLASRGAAPCRADTKADTTLNIAPSTNVFPEKGFAHLPNSGISLFLSERCKHIYFIRHAEGEHNAAVTRRGGDHSILEPGTPGSAEFVDAQLTAKGKAQCMLLRRRIAAMRRADPHAVPVELVVVSPLTRTLQTADGCFGPIGFPDAPPFLVHEGCRERWGLYTCDKRRAKKLIRADFLGFRADFPGEGIDWDSHFVDEEDESWTPEREPSAHVEARAVAFLQWLAERPEKHIAVVTHSSFLRHLFRQFGHNVAGEDQQRMHRVAGNCELRQVMLCVHDSSFE